MPLAKVWFSALTAFGVVVVVNAPSLRGSWGAGALFLLLGTAYTHLFEYGYHRLVMHVGVRFLGFAKKSHLEHHRAFNGENFTARSPEALEHIATMWYVFPSLLAVHYAVVALVLPPWSRVAFFAGVTAHYLVFETTHWFTHVEGNAFDRAVARIPLLRAVRSFQIRHHFRHHEIPDSDYNFNPPFLGDLLFGTWRQPPKNLRDL